MILHRCILAARSCLLALSMSVPLLGTSAQAQNVIASATVTPNTASTGTARQVLVTASIPSDNYIAGSAFVQRLDAAGRVLAVLGSMRDDGLEGDATAGDRVYTLRTTVLENDPGQVTYRVSAAFKGAALRVLSAPLTVTVSGVSTGVNIGVPGNGAYINTPAITVSGSAGDANAQVSVNGIGGVVSGNRFTASAPLNEGPNTLTAVATNSNGTTSTHSIVVTLDTTPPRVEVYSPLPNSSTTADRATVTGLVNDIVVGTVNAEQARVTVNGVAAEVSNRSFVARNVPLAMGANALSVVAEDRAGNRATAGLTVRRLPASGQPGLAIVSGDGQAGPVGRDLQSPLLVKLADANGAPQANKPVVFKVRTLDGVLSASKGEPGKALIAVNTDAAGLAQAWLRLGSRAGAGNNLIQASASGVASTADFAASGQAGAPALMVVDSGNNQYGVIGQPLPLPFIAIVTDAMNNRLTNVPVTLTVTQGGGGFPTATGTKASIVTNSDSDGRIAATLTLGPAEGVYNNVVEASFANNPGYAAAFMASGLAPAPAEQTRITGVVLDNSNQPLQGVTMRLLQINQGNRSNLPQQVANPVVSDAQGQFTMTGVPVGVFKLMADGSTAQRPGTWPTLEFDMVTVSGQNNTVGMPIFLPELLPQNRLCVSENTGGTLTVPEVPGFSLTIKPGSATFPGGARAGCVSVTPVHMDKSPMSPGFGQQPRFLVTIQPVGTHFNPPAQMSMPNVDGLLPGVVTEMYSYDHDLAAFVSIGSATVSRDGSTISSDPGVGVMKAGWHCGGNPNSSGSAGSCPECQKCQGSNCVPDNGGGCDDKDVCTRNDRCQNGVCKGDPIDVGTWTDDLSVQADVKLDKSIVNKINTVFNYIPGLGGVKFKDARVGVSGRVKNCCDKTDGVKERGVKEGQGTFQLTAEVANIPLWGSPTISKEMDFNIAIISIDVQVGLFFTTNLRLNAQGGYRKSDCKPVEECLFAETNVSLDPELKLTLEAILCQETLWTSKTCGGLTITPAAVRMNFAGRLTYNKPSCSSGLDGSLALGKVVLRAEFSLDVPAQPQRVVFQYELFGGVGQL